MNRIAELRKKHGMSQKELSQKLGIAQNTLSQYENELRSPSMSISTRMADIFEVSVNFLLGFSKEEHLEKHELDSLALYNVTQVTQTSSTEFSNILLGLGWKLLHIGESKSGYDDGDSSQILFTFGWFGNPKEAVIPDFEPNGEEYEEYI